MFSKAGEFARENQPQPLFAALAAGHKAQKRPAGLSSESCPTGSPDLRSAIRKKLNNGHDNEQHTKKKVSFWPMAYVVLIPTTDEYFKAGLASDLWWNEHDYKTFKRGALQDLQAFLLKNPELEPKTAVKMYFHHVEDGHLLDSPLQSFHNNCNNSVAIVPLNDSVQSVQDSSSADQKMDKRKPTTHHHSTEKAESCVEPSPESKGHHHAVRLPEKVSGPSVITTPSITVTPQLSACSGSSSSSSFEVLDLFSKVASMMLGSVVQDE